MSNPFRCRNQLLSCLPAPELNLLSESLERIAAPRRQQLEYPNKPIEHVYFVESGIATVTAPSGREKEVEVGIVGREGMTGIAVLHGNNRSPYSMYMQVGGEVLRIRTATLESLLEQQAGMKKIFLAFAQAFLIQVAETAVANARATIETRLARWLLMAHDRVDGDEIPLTHEFLSLMMGARRPGVTEGIHELTRKGLIAAKRGTISVLDRAGLEKLAGAHYGLPERERARLLGEADCTRPTESVAAGR